MTTCSSAVYLGQRAGGYTVFYFQLFGSPCLVCVRGRLGQEVQLDRCLKTVARTGFLGREGPCDPPPR
ncbi:Tyrosine-protein phosphatase Lar-like [Clarias magur]|uniref:Tyrosine-protein phosphatase Lar-like n=1 Tax=Clarias magur TaxID=1594786 RepID=A0A8J4XCE5_CLAMG|nr:Tyrosine-protein phosphatase Lar-like [Clarias magur]